MIHNVIIMGAGSAGLTSAIYTARAELKPLVVDGLQPGGQLTITTHVENFPGFENPIEGPLLMEHMRKQAERFAVQFISGEVTKADLSQRPFTVHVGETQYKTKTLIIASGASARWIGLDSEEKLIGRGVSACATCDGFFYRGKEVVVVGGGDTAMEEAMYLTHFATKVHVIHRRDELRASKIMQERAFANDKIRFEWNSTVSEILDVSKGVVTGVRLKDTKNGQERFLPCDGVFMAVGHIPNTSVFKGQLEMDPEGYIITKKSSMETSVAGVFAAGDCQDRYYRQAVTAVGTGCMAAIDCERFLQGKN